MTCLEAQSNIMAFIDKKLPDDKVTDFVRHMKHCPNCKEELEIHYTLIVGMRQLDNNRELSTNFKNDLENELNKWDNKVKKVKRFKISSFSIVFVAIVIFLFVVYGQILNKVYNIEQRIIKDKQGKYYFYENFNDSVITERNDIIERYSKKDIVIEKTFYEQVKYYNLTHSVEDEDEE